MTHSGTARRSPISRPTREVCDSSAPWVSGPLVPAQHNPELMLLGFTAVDATTLGGAGFASQAHDFEQPLAFRPSDFSGLKLNLFANKTEGYSGPTDFVLNLKTDTRASDQSGVVWEARFNSLVRPTVIFHLSSAFLTDLYHRFHRTGLHSTSLSSPSSRLTAGARCRTQGRLIRPTSLHFPSCAGATLPSSRETSRSSSRISAASLGRLVGRQGRAAVVEIFHFQEQGRDNALSSGQRSSQEYENTQRDTRILSSAHGC